MKNQSSLFEEHENEIDFIKLFQFVLDSKKIIIPLTLIFTLIVFYLLNIQKPSYKSVALIEIGNFKEELIESNHDLISHLNINYRYKNPIDGGELKIRPKEDRIVEITFTSKSADKNSILLNQLYEFASTRHLNLVENRMKEVSFEKNININYLTNRINSLEKSLEINNEKQKLAISYEIDKTDNLIDLLNESLTENKILLEDYEIEKFKIDTKLIELSQKKIELLGKLELLKLGKLNNDEISELKLDRALLVDALEQELQEIPSNTRLLDIKTSTLNGNSIHKIFFLIFGLIGGFVVSIFIAFVSTSFKRNN